MPGKKQPIFAFVEEPIQAATEMGEQHSLIRRCNSDSADVKLITPPETDNGSFYLLEKEVTMSLKPSPSPFRKSRSCVNLLQVDAMISCQENIGEKTTTSSSSRSYHSDTEIMSGADSIATSSSMSTSVYSMDIIESGDDMCRRRKWDEVREKRNPLRASSHVEDDSHNDPYAPRNVPPNVQLVIKNWGPAVAISPERFFAKLLLSRGYPADNYPLVIGPLKVPPSRQQITGECRCSCLIVFDSCFALYLICIVSYPLPIHRIRINFN